jgi:signal transduction histidine kinase
MGLGLGIIKNIIENYKGTITFDTVFGKGTTFTVSLPIINS